MEITERGSLERITSRQSDLLLRVSCRCVCGQYVLRICKDREGAGVNHSSPLTLHRRRAHVSSREFSIVHRYVDQVLRLRGKKSLVKDAIKFPFADSETLAVMSKTVEMEVAESKI